MLDVAHYTFAFSKIRSTKANRTLGAKTAFYTRAQYRTIIAFKIDDKAFFVYGFAKNDLENIDTKTLKAFKQLSKDLMGMNTIRIELALSNNELFEVDNHGKK